MKKAIKSASQGDINIQKVNSLINSLKNIIDILESMDDDTYTAVEGALGKTYYSTCLDGLHDLNQIRMR